jgi:hypothetical protein
MDTAIHEVSQSPFIQCVCHISKRLLAILNP